MNSVAGKHGLVSRGIKLIGYVLTTPWNPSTFLTGLMITLFEFTIVVRPLLFTMAPTPGLIAWAIGVAIMIGSSTFMMLSALNRVIGLVRRRRERIVTFYVGLFVFSLASVALLTLVDQHARDYYLSGAIRLFITALAFQIAGGMLQARLKKELEEKADLVDQLFTQRQLIVKADEETRRAVAMFLHNNIQASLVVLGTELDRVSKRSDNQTKRELQAIITEMETLRKVDVRQASRLLTPDLDEISLERGLQPLLDSYRDSMELTTNIAHLSPEDVRVLSLPIYRIVEQGLLNASVHGRATWSSIDVRSTEVAHQFQLVVENDGNSIPADVGQSWGTGFTVIDTWVKQLNGSWQLTNPQGRVRLEALLSTAP